MVDRVVANITLENIDDFFQLGKQITNVNTLFKTSQREQIHVEAQRAKHEAKQAFIPPYKMHGRENNLSQTAYADHYQKMEEDLLVTQLSQAKMTPGLSRVELTSQNNRSRMPSTGSLSMADTGERRKAGRPKAGMEDVESVTTALTNPCNPEAKAEQDQNLIYQAYRLDHKYNEKLATTKSKELIINTIESNQVTVIQGATGSGKTTQVPQYILDHYAAKREFCNIVVTQPRRIAAISIARRVCHERGWNLGGLCGYQIGMDRQMSEDTRILYCTTGVLLQKLIGEKTMQRFTHVILDEVHERDQETDFALLVVRKLLRTNSRDIKVVLMSATFDTEQFARYFSIPVREQMEPAPVISVDGSYYSVSEYHVEDLEPLGGKMPVVKFEDPGISHEAYILAKKLIMEFDTLEAKEKDAVIRKDSGFVAKRGSVLVFLPGLAEIHDFADMLDEIRDKHKLWILPLHSTITGEEQVRVFDTPEFPMRKVILSTNIAESSITVSDIKYVIDFCLTKNLMCDPDTNYTSLQIDWASKANCEQRKGRAGRLSNGRVYRMVTHAFYETYLPEYGEPEFRRCPLDQLVLKAKLLEMGEPKAILGLAISPPNLDDIERTVLQLKELGALTSLEGGAMNPHDGSLTFMGRVLASLPVDVHIGKFILLGHVFGLMEECIIIGASLSIRSFFARPFQAQLESYSSKLAWAGGSQSDCIAVLNAFKVWSDKHKDGVFMRSKKAEVIWAREHFIQIRRIKDVEIMVRELTDRLSKFNLRIPYGPRRNVNKREDALLLKVLMCGAFYPNYFGRIKPDEEMAMRTMSGHNPFTTVMVKGLPANQGVLYGDKLSLLFKPCQHNPPPKVYIEETRAYIEFSKSKQKMATQFADGVYLALKMRNMRVDLTVEVYDPEEARMMMKELDAMKAKRAIQSGKLRSNRMLLSSSSREEVKRVALPAPSMSVAVLCMTHVVDCGYFWAHFGDEATCKTMLEIHRKIAESTRTHMVMPFNRNQLVVGAYCLAIYEEDANTRDFYRACITKVYEDKMRVDVFYIDYGNSSVHPVPISNLRHMDEKLKEHEAQAFEVQLFGIRPCSVKSIDGNFTDEAKHAFERMIETSKLYAKWQNQRAVPAREAGGLVLLHRGPSFFCLFAWTRNLLNQKVYSVVHGIMRVELFAGNNMQDSINNRLIKSCYADPAPESLASETDHQKREEAQAGVVVKADDEWTTIEDDQLKQALSPQQNGLSSRPPRRSKINLSGPSNALEMQFYCINNMGRLRTVRVERDSVNSVALDDDPQDTHQRLLVAGQVTLNPSGTTLLARDTTIMPNIPGLPALMALLFCPTTELRTDREMTKYTGAICGLGWNSETEGPALPEHDIEIVFDVEIDQTDLELINLVRIIVDMAIGTDDREAPWDTNAVVRLQNKARSRVIDLLTRRRKPVTPQDFRKPYIWNLVREEQLLRPQINSAMNRGMDFGRGQLLNLHSAIILRPPDSERTESDKQREIARKAKLRKYIEDLHNKASLSTLKEEIMCELCNVILKHPRELKIHLQTRRHKEEETKILL